tara:strand:+ start:7542 stop:9176 length:1635 start_codon:yes stop_codon:yes gene_type:complete
MRIYLYINIILLLIFNTLSAKNNIEPKNYNELVNLFNEWRSFENPPLMNGAPDYTQRRFNGDKREFRDLRERLADIDTTDWPIYHQVDLHIVRAEMNGYDFNQRVLRPWVRDPAFYQTIWMYQSDVPAHEGPTNHGTLEFWTYEFPLDDLSSNKLATQLGMIPHFLFQAKGNLTGDAQDLWVAGIENFKEQKANLDEIKRKIVKHHGESHDGLLKKPLENAVAANDDFIKWLNLKAPTKNGPSGIGKDDYSWYQKNVHLVPLTWEEEVSLLQRELDRAWSSLKMEEHLNRNLPPMVSAKTEQEFDIMKEKGVRRLMDFLSDHDIMHMKDNMEPALREQMGKFVPEEDRNFFYIGMHYDPVPLYSHFYHWFDLAQVRDDPHKSPIRRGPLLYNIFDSKSEGIATGVEEMFMQLGLYEDSPRSKEIIWILLAQRAARGLGSLYAHANMMTMEEAGKVHVKWTPRKWMEREPHLLRFEQHLYLRQPGYGTCYITGKYLIERLITKRAEQLESQGKKFSIKEFLKDYNDAGNIPVGLIEWEMVGQNKK